MVDEDLKKNWEAAKAEKENTEKLITTKAKSLHELSLHEDTRDLARLMEDYTGLSLSGSLFIHVEKAIRLYRDMEEKGVNKEQSTESLDLMERKLELLKQAQKEKARKHSGHSG